MVIDPTNYKIAVSLAEAAAQQAEINPQNTSPIEVRSPLLRRALRSSIRATRFGDSSSGNVSMPPSSSGTITL